MNKLRNVLITLCFLSVILVPSTAYSFSYTNDLSPDFNDTLPSTTTIVNNANIDHKNAYLFWDINSAVYYLVVCTNFNSNYNFQALYNPSNQRLYANRFYGPEIPGNMTAYRYNPSMDNDWTQITLPSDVSYQVYFDTTNMYLYAFFAYTPMHDTTTNEEIFVYSDNGTNVSTTNPFTSRYRFNRETFELSESTVNSGEDDENDSVNVTVNIDLSDTNSILSSIENKVTFIRTYVSDIRDNLNSISSKINSINTTLSNLYSYFVNSDNDSSGKGIYYLLQELLDEIAEYNYKIQRAIGTTNSNNNTVLIHINGIKDWLQNDFITYFNGKYQTLYNILLYGNPNGREQYVAEQLDLTETQSDFDDLTDRLDSVPAAINSSADNISSYISTFTSFYEGFAALNIGVSALLYFALAVILIKKIIGR